MGDIKGAKFKEALTLKEVLVPPLLLYDPEHKCLLKSYTPDACLPHPLPVHSVPCLMCPLSFSTWRVLIILPVSPGAHPDCPGHMEMFPWPPIP